jgi:hypothetical protein
MAAIPGRNRKRSFTLAPPFLRRDEPRTEPLATDTTQTACRASCGGFPRATPDRAAGCAHRYTACRQYEHGNCPLFVTVGRVEQVAVPDEDGTTRVKTVTRLRYAFDERIEDGLYCARALELLREQPESPAGWCPGRATAA